MTRFLVVTTAVVVAVMSPALAGAKKKPPKPPAPGQERCEQAPTGGKGPIADAEVKATLQCFVTFGEAINETNLPAGGAAESCPSASADFNRKQGNALTSVADSGQQDVATTKREKKRYFKAEAEWYADHGSHRVANRSKVDDAVNAIGEVAFALAGYYAELTAEGEALKQNDCAGTQTHREKLVGIAKTVGRTELPKLRRALNALP
jgi:hypothetical protein